MQPNSKQEHHLCQRCQPLACLLWAGLHEAQSNEPGRDRCPYKHELETNVMQGHTMDWWPGHA